MTFPIHMSHLSLEYENMPIAVSFHVQIDPQPFLPSIIFPYLPSDLY